MSIITLTYDIEIIFFVSFVRIRVVNVIDDINTMIGHGV